MLLITDGEIWAADSMIRSARASRLRVHVLGVGTSPNAPFLRALADATAGRCEIVTPGEEVVAAVQRLFDAARSQAAEVASIDWGQAPRWQAHWPERPHPGQMVHCFAGLQSMPTKASIRVGEVASDAPVARPDSLRDDLRRIAANERLLCGQFADPVEASVEYQLLTEWTSLVAIHLRADAEKAGGLPALATVEHMVPAGWGGIGKSFDGPVVKSLNSPPMRWAHRAVADALMEEPAEPLRSAGWWDLDSQGSEPRPEKLFRIRPKLPDDAGAVAPPSDLDSSFLRRRPRAYGDGQPGSPRRLSLEMKRVTALRQALQDHRHQFSTCLRRLDRLILEAKTEHVLPFAKLDIFADAKIPEGLLELVRKAKVDAAEEAMLAAALDAALRFLFNSDEMRSGSDPEERARKWLRGWVQSDGVKTVAEELARSAVKKAIDSYLRWEDNAKSLT